MCERENVITLGWIHTHPEYSCFLSSVDLHNQYQRQRELPEMIATVVSIKDNEFRHLQMTEEGMMEVGSCPLSGFHPHSSQALVKEAQHVITDTDRNITVVNLMIPETTISQSINAAIFNRATYKLPRESDTPFPPLDPVSSYLQVDAINKLKRRIPALIR